MKEKRICQRCGGEIEDMRTNSAKYCIACSSKDDRLSITGVMREINRLHNMFVKLQCNFWELEKIIKKEKR
jgi:reverse gyrase